jgi:hypothetical protein
MNHCHMQNHCTYWTDVLEQSTSHDGAAMSGQAQDRVAETGQQ